MSKHNSQYELARNNEIIRKRLYKSKHGWNIAAMGALTLGAGMVGTMSVEHVAHADVLPTAQQQTSAVAKTAVATATPTEGSSVIQGPTTPTSVTTVTPIVNSANTAVAGAFSSQHNAIEDAGGTLNQANTDRVAVNNSNVQSADSYVKSNAQSQLANISATASADGKIGSIAKSDAALGHKIGAKVSTGSVLDASSMTAEAITKLGNQQVDRLNAVGSANTLLSDEVTMNSDFVAANGGTLVPGSAVNTDSMTPEEIQTSVASMASMLSVTGSAASAIVSASNQYTSNINAVGGQLKRSGVIDTADNMTVSDVQSTFNSQFDRISATAHGDQVIKSIFDADSANIAQAGGKLTMGSSIDVSKLMPAQIDQMVAGQSAMLSATVKGNQDINQAVSANQDAVKKVGGTLASSGVINTADNMTVSQVVSDAVSITAQLNATGSADKVVDAALSAASHAGVKVVLGSTVDVSNLQPKQVQALVDAQSAMISATVKADQDILKAVSGATSEVTAVGGHIEHQGTINTADDMTVSGVEKAAKSESDQIAWTADGDASIASAVQAASGTIATVSGALKAGSGEINVTSMTQAEIQSLVDAQSAMLSATASADNVLTATVKSAQGAINSAGGTIKRTGLVNTADNMTVSDVGASVKHQAALVNAVEHGDSQITKEMTTANSLSKPFGGQVITGSAVDVTSKDPTDVAKLAQSQVNQMSMVASGNVALSETQVKASDVVNAIGGQLSAGSNVDTTSLTSASLKAFIDSQVVQVSAVGDGDRQIGSAVTNNMNSIENAGGKILSAGAIDMSKQTAAEIEANAQSQAANIVATGQGDYQVSQEASVATPVITGFGGQVTKYEASDVSSLSGSEVKSLTDSKVANLSGAASETKTLSDTLNSAQSAIAAFGGTVTKGSAIDVSSMTPVQIGSLVQSEAAILSATASGDVTLSQTMASALPLISKVGGSIDRASDIDTASLSIEQITSAVAKQVQNMQDVQSADTKIGVAMDSATAVMKTVGGEISLGSSVDAESMTATQMDSLAQSEVGRISHVAAADAGLSSAIAADSGAVNGLQGGGITSTTALDATSMAYDQMDKLMVSQADNISDVAFGQTILSNGVKTNASAASLGTSQDFTGQKKADISSFVASQVVALGRATDADRVADSYASDMSGFKIDVKTSDVVASTAEGISSVADANTVAESTALDQAMKTGSASAILLKVKYVYHPLAVKYQAFDMKDTSLKTVHHVLVNHGTITPLNDSYTPYSTSFKALSDLGGYHPLNFVTTPLSVTYQGYESDGSKIPVYGKDGKLNPKFTGYAPLSVSYQDFESDGSKVKSGDKFTGMTAFSTKYQMFESDAKAVQKGHKFTGLAPLSTNYQGYSSDASKVKAGDKFTGFAPFNVSYRPLSTKYHFYQDVKAETPVANSAVKAPAGVGSGVSAGQAGGAVATNAAPAAVVASTVGAAPLLSGSASSPAGALPQTGHQNDEMLALLGLVLLASTMGASLLAKKRVAD